MSWRNGCQFRWKLDVLEGRKAKNYSVHMDFGSALHGTLEKIKSKKVEEKPADPKQFFEDSFRKFLAENLSFYRAKEQNALKDPGEVDYFVLAGRYILERFDDCQEIAEAEVVYNEYRLDVQIERDDDIDVKFKGFIDMVIKTKDKRGNTILYVCDFKTCSWGWPIEKKTDKDLHFQILLYKHFLCKKFNLDPKLVRTAFVLLKKRPAKGSSPIEFFPISAGPVSVQRAIDEMNKDLTEMHERTVSMNFIKNRQVCKNAFGDICPYLNSELCPE